MALDPGFVAYEAYRVGSDGKSLVSGAELPTWENLGENIRVAWRCAADGVLMMAQFRSDAPTESGPGTWPCGCVIDALGAHQNNCPDWVSDPAIDGDGT